ncbi:nuclear transport factor 2 family protein [Streptomyces sp. NRRL F-5755]|uniref:nuclear transport factor 2 family protein n=1 Tax=Streptomyces sp. NRRL F-5755 TaxID=1519475 RepID=UPI00099C2188|nr:nuclear transport factor 2 family protein [Streptomyces sp. NRRL F-5755]
MLQRYIGTVRLTRLVVRHARPAPARVAPGPGKVLVSGGGRTGGTRSAPALVRAATDDGTTEESWSRGTRVFRRRDGEWQRVHQHVSYPYDLEASKARPVLRP